MNWLADQRRLVSILMLLAGACFIDAGWIYLKAGLAQYLIKDAWQQTLQDGRLQKPWGWADTWPVARLQQRQRGVDLYVLQGSHGSSLAFGPGHVNGSAQIGDSGVVVLAGHRDTHFSFMQHLAKDDELQLTNTGGSTFHYRVVDLQVVDSSTEQLLLDPTPSLNRSELVLVTCYPFDGIATGGNLRFVVTAVFSPLSGSIAAESNRKSNEHTDIVI